MHLKENKYFRQIVFLLKCCVQYVYLCTFMTKEKLNFSASKSSDHFTQCLFKRFLEPHVLYICIQIFYLCMSTFPLFVFHSINI